MPNSRPTPQLRLLAPALALALALSACASSPGEQVPTGAKKVSGAITLPAGHGIEVSELEVVTPYGSYPVDADGRYTALVLASAETEIGVETPSGELLLLGPSSGAAAPLSLRSTAESLLYYAVGGMWLPAEHQDTVRGLLRERGEVSDLAAHLERLLTAGVNGLLEPDQELEDALETARASVLGGLTLSAAASSIGICPALAPSQAGTLSVIIHDGTTSRAGSMLLHDQGGLGILAMNQLRRPAALLAYEVSWQDLDQNDTQVDPPVLAQRVEVPATGNLEFFAAIGDVLTGDAPWAPAYSPQLVLSGHEGASLTQYEVVLVGPSLSGEKGSAWFDPRFASLQDEWEEIAFDKSVELFLDEMLLPLIEVYTLGAVAKFDAARLSKARQQVKGIYDNHLLGLGVYLKTESFGGYAAGLRFVLEELTINKALRSDMIGMITEALGTSDANRLSVEALDRKLATRAAASAVAAAVQTVMVGGDVAKILSDLSGNPMTASWEVEAMPARFLVDPPTATITKEEASARFTIRAIGDPPMGNYRFRWSTSGNHGELSDLLTDGVVIDTTSPEIWYFHSDPVTLDESDVDSILLEVFLVEAGATAIPEGAKPLGKGQAIVRGEPEGEMCVWECDEDGVCGIYCP